MRTQEDVRGTKLARAELTRRGIDLTRADIRVMHGIVHIRGTLSASKASGIENLKTEIEQIMRLIKQRPDIKDVILEATIH